MWYVLKVADGREDELCQKCKKAFLGREATEIFVPKYVWSKKVKGVRRQEISPLFFGYIFAETQSPVDLEKRLKIFRDVHPVLIGERFCPLEEEEEEALRQLLGEEKIVSFSIGYIVDGELKITNDGILKKFPEKVKKINRHKRLAELEFTFWGEKRTILVGLEVKDKITAKEFQENCKERKQEYETFEKNH